MAFGFAIQASLTLHADKASFAACVKGYLAIFINPNTVRLGRPSPSHNLGKAKLIQSERIQVSLSSGQFSQAHTRHGEQHPPSSLILGPWLRSCQTA